MVGADHHELLWMDRSLDATDHVRGLAEAVVLFDVEVKLEVLPTFQPVDAVEAALPGLVLDGPTLHSGENSGCGVVSDWLHR